MPNFTKHLLKEITDSGNSICNEMKGPSPVTLTSLPYDGIKIPIRAMQQSGLKSWVFEQGKGGY